MNQEISPSSRRGADREELLGKIAELLAAFSETALSDGPMALLARVLLESIPQKIAFKDTQSRYLACNVAFAKALNIRPEQIVGKTDFNLFPLDLAEKYHTEDRRILLNKVPEEIEESFLSQGRELFVRTLKTPVLDKNGKGIGLLCVFWELAGRKLTKLELNRYYEELEELVASRARELLETNKALKLEVAERQTAEAQLRQSQQQMRAILDNIPDIAWLKDKECRFIMVNQALAKQSGFPADYMIGKNDYDFFPRELSDKYRADDLDVMRTAQRKVTPEYFTNSEGQTSWIETIKTPVMNQKGEVIGTAGIARDITARVNSEKQLIDSFEQLRRTQAQLLQSEKLASLGQLAAGVAHEINNPMGFIASNLSTLGQYVRDLAPLIERYRALGAVCREGGKTVPLLEEIARLEKSAGIDFILGDFGKIVAESCEGAERVKEIVLALKSFSHADEKEKGSADLNNEIETTLRIVWNEIKHKASVEKNFGALPPVRCFRQQINQVFMNLLVNAAQAIEKDGLIRICTRAEGGSVFVEVSDNGCGIPPEAQKHIFEPFFTTKQVGSGTGLGLSMSYNIVKDHGGELSFVSAPGEGTTFTVRLPVNSDS